MSSETLRIANPRCEYLVEPQGLDETSPRFSWELECSRRGVRQGSYQVLVASSREALEAGQADLWDSGHVDREQSSHVAYAGKALGSRQRAYWKVLVSDESGAKAESSVCSFSLGLLKREDWSAKWIAADPRIIEADAEARKGTLLEPGTPAQFRKEFTVSAKPVRATLYMTARGLVEAQISGQRVGNDQMAPEWTDYDKRLQYRSYDVTDLVKAGPNAIGAYLGDGWWSGYVGWQETRARYGSLENSLLLQLEVEYADGSIQRVVTDESWTAGTGAILSSDFMMGEVYDARREQAGWSSAGFKSAKWLPARVVESPTVPLVAQRSEPVSITELLQAVSIRAVAPSTHIIDFGQNISGWVRLRVRGEAGTRVVIRHGERLSPDGSLYTENLRRAKSVDVYILKGEGEEVWQPRFTFHGFQYVEISGLATLTAENAVACVVHSATPAAGSFDCSHAGVRRLWLNGCWSQRDNFLSVPTDCPQRDERLGWMGDAQVFLRTASYNMDVAAFFTKWMVDVEDAQTPEGIFPDVAPRLREGENFIGLDGLGGAAGWADAGVIVPWTIWRVYGDRRILERHWKAMTNWLEYLDRSNPNGLRLNELANNYGDWLCIPADTTFRTHSPMKNLLATAYWADDAAKVAIMAEHLKRKEDAARYRAMFEKIRAAFQKEFCAGNGRLKVETQTSYLLVLAMNLIPDDQRQAAAERLVELIRDENWHLSTGFIGISHLNPTLTLAGYPDVAYKLLLRDDYPSWLYPVMHGATTIWERWNGWTEKDGFFNPHMNSFNHYSLGSVGEWLFRHVAGIELDPAIPGFKHFILKPYIGEGLEHASASYKSMHGRISSAWKKLPDGRLEWRIAVPVNTRATVHVPAKDLASTTEGGQPLDKVAGIALRRMEDGYAVFEAGSGDYVFTSSLS